MRGTRKSTWLGACPCGIIPAHAGNTGEGAETRAYPIGSSPRMRGTPDAVNHAPHAVGIIPAHAGNTAPTPTWSRRPRDHPRACGEHNTGHHRRTLRTGSSPRMRGTRLHRDDAKPDPGIIPAHAGNTYWTRWAGLPNADHPRACGEHWINARRNPKIMGSSPRMRGTREYQSVPEDIDGIIPAHAGNTRAGSGCPGWPGDHPRACGEHLFVAWTECSCPGSSPRMRGTQCRRTWYPAIGGIIPAHAGNTVGHFCFLSNIWDHPRACGEHDTPLHTPLNVIGSSPRMRGTPAQHRALLDESRIIPAHAGNTSRGSCAWYPRRDHPRACGEHVLSP